MEGFKRPHPGNTNLL